MNNINEPEALKQITLYNGISKNNIVSKSRDILFDLPEMTINQIKLLDIYLSRIDPHNPEKSRVIFRKKDFEQMLGIKRIKDSVMENLLDTLLKTTAKDYENKEHYTLFSKLKLHRDENGERYIEMTANPEAAKVFFNVERVGYIKYQLGNIVALNSLYSIKMFTYLYYNKFRTKWSVEIAELKKILGCDREQLYNEYKYFNIRILKKVCDEINEKTSLKYKYIHKKDSTKIEFAIIQIDKMMFLEDTTDKVNLYKEIADVFKGLSTEQIENIEQELILINSDWLLEKYNTTDLTTAQISLLNDLNNEYIKDHPSFENNYIKSCVIEEKLRILRSEE